MKYCFFVLFLFGANSLSAQEVRRALPVETPASAFDEQAKFLAGVPLPKQSPLAPLQNSAAYRSHAAEFERMWAHYNAKYFTPMQQWSALELAPRLRADAPVFYFFGGPDALTALAYYPQATDYILGGLEPVGSMPPPDSLDPSRLDVALGNLRQSMNVTLFCGFFITKDMKAELERTEFRGVLPVLLAFLAMRGAEVRDVSYFGVHADGKSEDFGLVYTGGRGVIPGVRITFRCSASSPPQRLYYVQSNVADDALQSHGGILAWSAAFGRGNVYLKAASYLMHETYFSKIQTFLLTQALSVLQDDSGIPLKFFQNGEWRCWFFGIYSGPLDIFKKYHQPDLEKAFQQSGIPLAFGTGYKWKAGESNLMLAIRQIPPRAEPVLVPTP